MKYTVSLFITIFFSIQLLTAQTPEQLKSYLPQIDGWTISEKVEVFNPDNLFDRINGAAPLYLENNFREMTSMEYTKGDDYITIQAYRHASPEDAFGMYASERSPGLTFFPFAGEAQGDDANVFFFAGSVYVKMWCSASENISETLQTIAKELAQKIDPNAGYPAVVNAFLIGNKVPHTEAYITSSYIGHEFLKSVYTCKYIKDGKEFQLFIVDAKTNVNAKDVLTKYFTFTKQPLTFNEGELMIKDRYNGDIPALWTGKYIIGIFSESGNTITDSSALLKEVSDNLFQIENQNILLLF